MSIQNDVKIIPAKLGTLVAMCGLPRSGKSTIAKQLSKELSAPIVKKDDIRLALHGQVYQTLAEPFVKAISKVMVHSLFLSGHQIVIADETHYSRAARDFMADGPWETKFYLVDTPKEVCIERAYKTGHTWLPPVIEEMAARWEPLGKDEKLYKGYRSNPVEVMACAKCNQDIGTDRIDRMIYHTNGHVWPGFAGDPS